MIGDVVNGPFGRKDWEGFAKRLVACKQLILYHGTSSTFLEHILQQGLLPRSHTGNSVYGDHFIAGKKLESQPDLVYLIHRSRTGIGSNNAVSKYGGKPVILRVLVDTSQLVPDEDSRRKSWYESIAWEDSCAYQGVIPPKNILGWGNRSPRQPPYEIMYNSLQPDPSQVFEIECNDPPRYGLRTNRIAQAHAKVRALKLER